MPVACMECGGRIGRDIEDDHDPECRFADDASYLKAKEARDS